MMVANDDEKVLIVDDDDDDLKLMLNESGDKDGDHFGF